MASGRKNDGQKRIKLTRQKLRYLLKDIQNEQQEEKKFLVTMMEKKTGETWVNNF